MPTRLVLIGTGATPDLGPPFGRDYALSTEQGYRIVLAQSGSPSLVCPHLSNALVQLSTKHHRWHHLVLEVGDESSGFRAHERVLVTKDKLTAVGLGDDPGGSLHAALLGLAARKKNRLATEAFTRPLTVTGMFLHAELPTKAQLFSILGAPSAILMRIADGESMVPKLPLVLKKVSSLPHDSSHYLKPASWSEVLAFLKWCATYKVPTAVGCTTIAHLQSGDFLKENAHSPLHCFEDGELDQLIATDGSEFASLAGAAIHLCKLSTF